MPEKPKEFQPSNESVQQHDKERQPDDQPATPSQGAVVPPPAGPAPAPQNLLGSQESAKITIQYADRREEVIHVVNPDWVRGVAQAGRIIRPHDSGMSSSFLEMSQPHPVSTSSLPAAFPTTSSLPESLAPGAHDGVDDVKDVDRSDHHDQSSGVENVHVSAPVPVLSTSVDDGNSEKDQKEDKKKTTKKEKPKYQSHSSPALAEVQPKKTKPDVSRLYTTPIPRCEIIYLTKDLFWF